MPQILIYTLGCKVNQYESEAILEQFLENGYTLSQNALADVIVINSCTVTAESDRKTRQLLHRVRRENPDSAIILTGCMVQAFGEKSAELTDADILIGNTETNLIFEKTKEFLENGVADKKIAPHSKTEDYCSLCIKNFSERTRAFMKIEDGCDRYCTYCIIPFARGRIRSRTLESIKEEAVLLSSAGFKEIVLVGINLSSYGKGEEFNLCDVVEAVAKTKGIERVRLGSLEPDLISDEMLKRLFAIKEFCPQFHLSLQSGCDSTLKRMNRHYDSEFFYDLVTRIRNIFDNPSITTDIMVGFPSESNEEFSESFDFVKKVRFAKAHIFSYSRRDGTIAAALKNQVLKSEKLMRSKRMQELCTECERAFLKTQLERIEPVLFETFENGFFVGYTKNYTKVYLETKDDLAGKIINVKLVDIKNDGCLGILA